MKNIQFREITVQNHVVYAAKTSEGFAFIGRYDGTLDELKQWFGISHQFTQGNIDDFLPLQINLEAYLSGEKKLSDLPFDLGGTAFQNQVWDYLRTIPYGETKTYKEVADGIGKPSATRAVASAIGKNPLLILIPCHRVIGSDGALRGYRGGLDMKRELLLCERDNH